MAASKSVTVTQLTVIYRWCTFCWFCSDCCWSLQHLSRMIYLTQFMATHGN